MYARLQSFPMGFRRRWKEPATREEDHHPTIFFTTTSALMIVFTFVMDTATVMSKKPLNDVSTWTSYSA